MVVLNERKYAEELLASEKFPDKPTSALNLLVRYFKEGGRNRGEVRKLLEEYLQQRDPQLNLIKWQRTIERSIRAQWKYELIEIDSIPITRVEMKICENIKQRGSQRLMFTLICLAKFFNAVNEKNNGWVNQKDNDIFNAANVKLTIRKQSIALMGLHDLGLIEFSNRVDNINIRVTCLSDPEDQDIVMQVTKFQDLGNQYLAYHGEKFLECNMCGKFVRRTNNRQQHCRDCTAKINYKQKRISPTQKRTTPQFQQISG